MPVTKIRSRWDTGALIFHESTRLDDQVNVLTLAPGQVTVGDENNDVDFKIWMGSSNYVLFDYAAALVTFSGIAVTLAGDLIVTTEDISVIQGKYVFFEGQDGASYIVSDTAGDLKLNTTTNIDFAFGGTDEVRLTATVFSPATSDGNALGSGTLMWGDLFLADDGVINWNNGDTTLTATGNLLTLGASGLSVGADGAGFDIIFYGDRTGSDFFWDQDGQTNGSLNLGTTTVSEGVDLFVHGDTATNYLHWDCSADDLILVGTATQLVVEGTVVSSSTTTGSLRTAGGLGVEGRGNFGGIVIVTSTNATTAGVNAIFGDNAAGAVWTSGNQVGVRGRTTITGGYNIVSATGVWAGLVIQDAWGAGTGVTCGLNAEVWSDNAQGPNAVVYIQSLPAAGANFSDVPYLVFSETRGGAINTGSRYLFEVGHAQAGTIPGIGTGELFYQNTLQIAVNETTGNRTSFYIPLSTEEASYTTDYPIHLNDDVELRFGSAAGGDITFAWTEEEIEILDTRTLAAADYYRTLHARPTIAMYAGSYFGGLSCYLTLSDGSGGIWAGAIVGTLEQGTTKNITGYMAAGIFEMKNLADNCDTASAIYLNWKNQSAVGFGGAAHSFIRCHDTSPSDRRVQTLFELYEMDATTGASASEIVCQVGSAGTASHVIKITCNGVPYWIGMSSTSP